ncbi:MAG: putative 2-oxoglutarate/Fe(II)-dependent dioxygenase YbiX [Bradymonadia bacterium]|jgi:predicted 2-oxoglutarate/Fe(II)-dependent dioxygenase YbiX
MTDRADELAAFGYKLDDGFLEPGAARELQAAMRTAASEPVRVFNPQKGEWFDSDSVRSTRTVTVLEEVREALTARFVALLPELSEHFGVELSSVEPLSFLRYLPGDHFVAHRDAEKQGAGEQSGRLVSLVFFVNDAAEFEGGELLICPFDVPEAFDLAIDLQPRAGRLIAFPSHTLHQVLPVRRGERFSVVSWAR